MNESRSIAVAAGDHSGLEGRVAGHFGRCPAYVVVRTVGRKIESARVVKNPYFETHTPGDIPRFIQGLGVEAILAGGMGRRAVGLFSELGIDVATGLIGTVRDVVGGYLRGELGGTVPCNHDHAHSCGGSHHA